MNLLVNEPTRRPGQPLCQDPWHLDALGVWLTELTKTQAEYLDVDVAAHTRRTSTATDQPGVRRRNRKWRYAVRSCERPAYRRFRTCAG